MPAVNLYISCIKDNCKFEIEWTGCESIEKAKQFYYDWNKQHSEVMKCIHDYDFKVIN